MQSMKAEEILPGFKLGVKKNDQLLQAEILGTRTIQEKHHFYVHYTDYNRRLDEWVPYEKLDTSQVEIPKKKPDDETLRMKNVNFVWFGDYLIEAWYFSPYPQRDVEMGGGSSSNIDANNIQDSSKIDNNIKDNAEKDTDNSTLFPTIVSESQISSNTVILPENILNNPLNNTIIYICEFCLFYFGKYESLKAHECGMRTPPGDEIWRHGNLSFFEVDGHMHQNYCRNLSLLSKLFLDHKTLYFDIDVFMFYVLTIADKNGCHIVGYFSKEKQSEHGYNLACILTLPHCQRKGYGKILIDFSYLLSRKEGKIASPEKPLSDLGLLGYRAYWTEVILNVLKDKKTISIKEISKITGIAEDDIVNALTSSQILHFYNGEPCFVLNDELIKKGEKAEKYSVDESALKWNGPVDENSEEE